MTKHWREITLTVPGGWAEILPGFLEALGFSGLWMDDVRDRPEELLLRAYMAHEHWDPLLEQRIKDHLESLSRIFSDPDRQVNVQVRVIEEEDWASKWLPFFEPLRIGTVWIRPTEKNVALAQGEKEIILDPGQAFGTGHHATTKIATPPTNHAMTTGHGPKRYTLIKSAKSNPKTAAGTKPARIFITILNPPASFPASPMIICFTLLMYNPSTAKIAPACIQIA